MLILKIHKTNACGTETVITFEWKSEFLINFLEIKLVVK